MWKKDDNVGSKSGYKRKLLSREKEESKKKKLKSPNFGLWACPKTKKPC